MKYPLVENFLATFPEIPVGACLYGSYFSGNWVKGKSDIDLILFVEEKNTRKHERHLFDGAEIHTTLISLDTLQDDVYYHRYGYLYISKFINPHVFILGNNNVSNKVVGLVSKYLEEYCFIDIFDKPLSLKQIISRVLLVHLNNFPHYAIKLTRLSKEARDGFYFEAFYENYTEFLKRSALLSVNSEGKYFLKETPNLEENYRAFFHEKVRLIWWQTYQNYKNTENFLENKIRSYEDVVDSFSGRILQMRDSLERSAE